MFVFIFNKIAKKLYMNFFWNRTKLRSKLNFWNILEYVSPRFTEYLANVDQVISFIKSWANTR